MQTEMVMRSVESSLQTSELTVDWRGLLWVEIRFSSVIVRFPHLVFICFFVFRFPPFPSRSASKRSPYVAAWISSTLA